MSKRENSQASDRSAPLPGIGGSRDADKQRIADLERQLYETELALRLSSSKLRMALDIAKLGSWERNLETGEMAGTAIFKACLGLEPDAKLTHPELEAMFHPADLERINQAVSYALRTRTDFNIEHRILKAD